MTTRTNQTENPLIYGKIPPQVRDIEKAVLGAVMLEKTALGRIEGVLLPNMFYVDAHQRIFEAFLELSKKGRPIDLLEVVEELKAKNNLDAIGGPYELTKITNSVTGSANLEYHSQRIIEAWKKREMIILAGEIMQMAYSDENTSDECISHNEKKLTALLANGDDERINHISNVLIDVWNDTNAQMQKRAEMEAQGIDAGIITGISTGFTDLNKITNGWEDESLIILAARPAMGKCLGYGTKVLMYNGKLKEVQDIVVGDLLMGDDSTPRRVLSLATGSEMMYWVHQNHGISYRVNESHILSLKRSRTEWRHKNGDVLNIQVSEYIGKSKKFKSNYKGYKVAVDFSDKSVELDPYFMGIWLGDGDSRGARITSNDSEVIDYLNAYADVRSESMTIYKHKFRCATYRISGGKSQLRRNSSVQATLRKMNVLENKHIPENYLINSLEKRLYLLAGLIDSDGYYDDKYVCFEIVQKNKNLAMQIKFLCDSLGFKVSFRRKKSSCKSRNYISEAFRIRISGDIHRIPTRIPRKKARVRLSKIDWRNTGITLEQDKVDQYYGFEIDGNKLFLLEDMTVTHNTALALNLARNAAENEFKSVNVGLFSMEMSAKQLVQRMVASESNVFLENIKKGKLSEHYHRQMYEKGLGPLSETGIYLDDSQGLTLTQLKSKARKMKRLYGVGLIIIDYLQLMSGENGYRGNREQEISTISRGLKGLAKELRIPVIALSQLSRSVESRENKKPILSDLRESGAIEQDADMVMFLYRPEYYNKDTDENGESTKGLSIVSIAKHRSGETGDVNLRADLSIQRFFDWDGEALPAAPGQWKKVDLTPL